jgi:hypothetical protein
VYLQEAKAAFQAKYDAWLIWATVLEKQVVWHG